MELSHNLFSFLAMYGKHPQLINITDTKYKSMYMYIYQEGCGLIDVAINLFAFLYTMSMVRWLHLGINRIFIREGCTLGADNTIFHMEITIINFSCLREVGWLMSQWIRVSSETQ